MGTFDQEVSQSLDAAGVGQQNADSYDPAQRQVINEWYQRHEGKVERWMLDQIFDGWS